MFFLPVGSFYFFSFRFSLKFVHEPDRWKYTDKLKSKN